MKYLRKDSHRSVHPDASPFLHLAVCTAKDRASRATQSAGGSHQENQFVFDAECVGIAGYLRWGKKETCQQHSSLEQIQDDKGPLIECQCCLPTKIKVIGKY